MFFLFSKLVQAPTNRVADPADPALEQTLHIGEWLSLIDALKMHIRLERTQPDHTVRRCIAERCNAYIM